ncbi:MAG: hypothetical protein K0R39_4679 [Symbiobacteriaceae bacterium]|nr:hypothetical protein [Symbiobacteriaceae bacterium]
MSIHKSVIDERHTLLAHGGGASQLAVFFPGANYGCEAPLLWYARKAALLAGCDTLSLVYRHQVDLSRPFTEQMAYLVEEASAAIRRVIQPGCQRMLFVSKSMGTVVAGEVAERLSHLPVSHLVLTPTPHAVPYLQRARGIVLTGTADPKFGEPHLSRIRGVDGLEVIAVPEAVHSLELDGDVAGSLRILGQVCEACARLAGGATDV